MFIRYMFEELLHARGSGSSQRCASSPANFTTPFANSYSAYCRHHRHEHVPPESPEEFQSRIRRVREEQEQAAERRKKEEARRKEEQEQERARGLLERLTVFGIAFDASVQSARQLKLGRKQRPRTRRRRLRHPASQRKLRPEHNKSSPKLCGQQSSRPLGAATHRRLRRACTRTMSTLQAVKSSAAVTRT